MRTGLYWGSIAILTALLACSPRTDGRPELDVSGVARNIMIPMRDGVSLATDLYFPQGRNGAHPVVLVRTPYNKTWVESYGRYFSRSGYVVAVQDVRGRWASEGPWEPFVHEGEDGFDTIEWLAGQEWCNEKVGMVGGSYSGSAQFAAAILHPPHLVTIVPAVTPAMPFDNLPFQGGVFQLGWAVRWTDIVENATTGRELQAKLEESISANWEEPLSPLPVSDLDLSVVGREIQYFRNWVRREAPDEFWHPLQYLDALEEVDIPVFLQSGWFDGGNRGSFLAFDRLSAGGNRQIRLVVGPWVHSDRGTRFVNGIDMGPEAEWDLMAEYRRWLDRWLKGQANGIDQEDPVHLYLMGSRRWLTGDQYPLPGTNFRPLYLAGPSTEGENGRLQWDAPPIESSFESYLYDPGNPTPSFYAYLKRGRMGEYQEGLSERNDLLVYESEPASQLLRLSGPISLNLYASSSAPDTDWVATLYAVDPNGNVNVLGLTFGALRARYREGMDNPSLLEPGRVYPFTLDLSHTSVTLPPGHRLRLEVASAAFPELSRNLNTGGQNETEVRFMVARQRVYHGPEWPAHVLLPVVEMDDR